MLRIDGKLVRLDDAPVDLAGILALPTALEARYGRTHSLDLGLEIPDVGRVRVHVFRADGSSSIFHERDEITGESLLPSFRTPVSAFFAPATAAARQP